jgi:hypothetical protein
MALKLPREILWEWHLRYLITEMKFKTSERPSSWQLPWGHLLQLPDGLDNNTRLQGLLQVQPDGTLGRKNCPSPHPPPGPCPRCGQNGHWKDDCPSLSLQGRSVSHSQQSEGLMDLLGLAAEEWYGPGTSVPFKITSEEPRVTIQVAGRPQSPTWCHLTSQVSFILHRSPWWGWTVSSTSQKRKDSFI